MVVRGGVERGVAVKGTWLFRGGCVVLGTARPRKSPEAVVCQRLLAATVQLGAIVSFL